MKKSWIVPTVTFVLISASVLLGSDCETCNDSIGILDSVPAVEPITIRADGKIRKISLMESFRIHGRSCPGMTSTYRALQYGLLLLFGKEIPDKDDLVINSRTPAPGAMAMLDLVMIGENRTNKTNAPRGMTLDGDLCRFTLYRKSTNTAVDIRVKPEHYPKNFFEYKKKQAVKKLTPEEWQLLRSQIREMVLKFPAMSFEDLFGKPQPYTTITWGTLMPADTAPPVSDDDIGRR